MRKLDNIGHAFDRESRNPANWPSVNTAAFSEEKRHRFNSRKRALDLYLHTTLPNSEVLKRSGLSCSGLKRLVRRAFTVLEDGSPAGYLACIPDYRLKSYTRTDQSNAGKAGQFSLLLENHPEIKDQLDKWALGKAKINGAAVRGKHIDQIWRDFKSLCDEAGLCDTDYPLTNHDGGREAVRRYCKKRRQENFIASSRVEFGDEAGRLAAQGRTGGKDEMRLPLRPYERIQLDGHKVDIILTIELTDEHGELVQLPISRVWLLVAIDTASRAVLGYSISLLENYSSEDVLECVSNSLSPWSPRDPGDAPVKYAQSGGLPSGVIDECAWRCFDVLQYDNAYAHISRFVQERLIAAGINEVQTNRPASPRSNALVERFNKTFEAMSLHRLPMTTGTGPKDPRRGLPEKSAVSYEIRLEDLELITDITIANYNATPHEALRGRSPLDYIRLQLTAGRSIPRYTTSKSIDGLKLFERDFEVTIQSNSSQGHRPSIKFKGVRYTGEAIEHRPDLAGCAAFFRVNIRDIRSGTVFLRDGTCLGTIHAEISWMALPHSIQVRKAICKLVKQSKLSIDTDFPVAAYMKYLKRRSLKSKKSRNKLLTVQRQSKEAVNDPNVMPPPLPKRAQRSAQAGWISIGIKENNITQIQPVEKNKGSKQDDH